MKSHTCLLFAATALSLSSGAIGQITQQGSGFLLRHKFAAGQVYRYSNDTSVAVAGATQPFSVSMPFSISVKSVKNGVATLEYKVKTPALGNGGGGDRTSTVQVDAKGKPVGEGSMPGSGIIGFPEKPVVIGQSWPGNMAGATGGMAGMKTVDGKRVAAVAISPKAKNRGGETGMDVVGAGTMYFNVSDGSLHSLDMKLTVKMNMGGGKPMDSNATTKIRRTK
ncbi:MAG: hypothetical protein HZC36_04585 [Armatimonadetes bacterium]|nr:hypothetical protein [Armatimonadota bacterium]